ncbi:MAG: HpaII family restriction endonuclease [Bacteroidales bacterium]|nr:HpaII family restriction endonuclease [Bacteroidales bacterium]
MALFSGNKGEWAEVYVFFKVIADRRLYTADVDYNPIKDIYLDVLGVLREEEENKIYCYRTGKEVTILLNHQLIGKVPTEKFDYFKDFLWKLIETKTETTFSSQEVEDFLNSIFVYKPKSPGRLITKFSGGTVDIVLETQDRSGIVRTLGFSIKSDLKASATLLNASQDNTNFVYEVLGPMDDDKMNTFNAICTKQIVKGEEKSHVATADRIQYLKDLGCKLQFVNPVKDVTRHNLIMCGGIEMPLIVAGMLKHFYWNNYGGRTTVEECVDALSVEDPVGYGFEDLKALYHSKISNFLYYAFTGLKLGSQWNGKTEVNGGYIVVKRDGDVVAFHSTIADEFKDFLLSKMIMEAPSHSRHGDMSIYKENGKYYLKLALQLRFKLKR